MPFQAPELSKITRIRSAPRTAAEPAPVVICRLRESRTTMQGQLPGEASLRRSPENPPPTADQKEYALTDMHDLLDQIPVDQIAALLGTDPASARAAVETAVPTLLAGLQNNAQAPDGAASLKSALAQHQDGLADGGVDATQLDTADGEKIVSHVFGGQQDQVASQLTARPTWAALAETWSAGFFRFSRRSSCPTWPRKSSADSRAAGRPRRCPAEPAAQVQVARATAASI